MGSTSANATSINLVGPDRWGVDFDLTLEVAINSIESGGGKVLNIMIMRDIEGGAGYVGAICYDTGVAI